MDNVERLDPIFHIAPRADWQRALATGTYSPASLASVGFLHGSLAHQILPVANTVFRGKLGLLLLEIDPHKLGAEVRHEDLRGSGAPYPHIYGPINCPAVVATYAFEPKPDGTFVLPKKMRQR